MSKTGRRDLMYLAASSKLSCASPARIKVVAPPARWRPAIQWVRTLSPAKRVALTNGQISAQSELRCTGSAMAKVFNKAPPRVTPPRLSGLSDIQQICKVTPVGNDGAVDRVGMPLIQRRPPFLFSLDACRPLGGLAPHRGHPIISGIIAIGRRLHKVRDLKALWTGFFRGVISHP